MAFIARRACISCIYCSSDRHVCQVQFDALERLNVFFSLISGQFSYSDSKYTASFVAKSLSRV